MGFYYVCSFDLEDKWYIDFIMKQEKANEILNAGFMADAFPILGYLPNPRVNQLKKLNETFRTFLDTVMKEHRDNFNPGNMPKPFEFFSCNKTHLGGEIFPIRQPQQYRIEPLYNVSFMRVILIGRSYQSVLYIIMLLTYS